MSLQIALRSGSAQKLCSLIQKMQNVEMSSSKLEQLGSLFCCIYIPCRSFRLRRLYSDQFFGFAQGKYFRLKVIFSKREVCPLGR